MLTRSAVRDLETPSPNTARQQRSFNRLARTPIRPAQIERLTLPDFLREVDIHFLDHMRRGASINLADLASDPPPSSLQVSTMLKPSLKTMTNYRKTLTSLTIIGCSSGRSLIYICLEWYCIWLPISWAQKSHLCYTSLVWRIGICNGCVLGLPSAK